MVILVRTSFGLFPNDAVENLQMVPVAQFVTPGHGDAMEKVGHVVVGENPAYLTVEINGVENALNLFKGIVSVVFQTGNDRMGARETPCSAEIFNRVVLFLVVVELDSVEVLLQKCGEFFVNVDVGVLGLPPFLLKETGVLDLRRGWNRSRRRR